ncbi:MAG: sensor histidine kinase, partial [Candidatus Binatia bacterium]
ALRLAAELLARVRELSLDLRPAMLDDLGLVPALVWHLGLFEQRTNVRVTLEHAGLDARFDPKIETAAYRIIQEALTNVARHAGARESAVEVRAGGGCLRIQIDDCGRGFDVESALSSGTSGGLIGMRERAVALGGHFSVVSSADGGTRVSAELPLDPSPAVVEEERR